MVCHCKPSERRMGCGEGCLNRMLNVECVRGSCPCGERCSNQQFQKRNYAKLKCFKCGKKGYGLQLLEDVSKGQFLIEYVGEVLDLHAYDARQKEYALKGHKHFYFMTLNGSEVIDACAKGNLGRFINHSCDPNCCTEKWMVNGEVCIGLFALRDIKKDASRCYLKLLLLTAASGDNCNGEAIQSNRDLSMILDALLKTKSRTVLVDIIDKNGLQMLHNIMKRSQREFNKIPILRKLLKVLEYLAARGILSHEHINGGPSRPGVESFRVSILGLTEHIDKQAFLMMFKELKQLGKEEYCNLKSQQRPNVQLSMYINNCK